MQAFYKKSLLILIALLAVDALLAGWFLYRSRPSYTLSPALRDGIGWEAAAGADSVMGGTSTARLDPSRPDRLAFDYRLTKVARYPFASAQFVAKDAKGQLATVDLSRYDTVTFLARCKPAGPMNFGITIFDDKVSKPGDFITYRSPATFFPCNEQGVPVSLDTRRMTIPGWWFHMMKLKPASHDYKLDKVAQFVFGTSSQAPFNVDSHVEISELTFHGRDDRYIAALGVILLAGAVGFAVWFFRTHARALAASLTSQMNTDLPLRAYRQLSVEPYRDPEKASVLKFIATNYTNPQLDLDNVVAGTGTNRNKVNELLKKELGITFSAYLNKLRLTEAARLLAENSAAAIAEIAYSVGYANVPYFNKLFKEEYGCTPKAFRSLAEQQRQAAPSLPADTPPAGTVGSD